MLRRDRHALYGQSRTAANLPTTVLISPSRFVYLPHPTLSSAADSKAFSVRFIDSSTVSIPLVSSHARSQLNSMLVYLTPKPMLECSPFGASRRYIYSQAKAVRSDVLIAARAEVCHTLCVCVALTENASQLLIEHLHRLAYLCMPKELLLFTSDFDCGPDDRRLTYLGNFVLPMDDDG
jgi:hypothetical protein